MNNCYDCGRQFEAQAWLWQHKLLFLSLGVLLVVGLLVVGGNGM